MSFSIQRRAIADNAYSVGNENLVDLLQFRREQAIKGVVETNLSILAVVPQPCLRVALRNLEMARATISPSVSPLAAEYLRRSRTTLPGIFNVMGTETSVMGTGWPIAAASSR